MRHLSQQYFFHTDHLGSSSFISHADGEASQFLAYLPFGEQWIEQQRVSFTTEYKFSGKELDTETGYNYFGARYYDSGLSVWLSVDPLSSYFPTLTPYNYVFNNPLRYVDPFGLSGDDPPISQVKKWRTSDRVGFTRYSYSNNQARGWIYAPEEKSQQDVESDLYSGGSSLIGYQFVTLNNDGSGISVSIGSTSDGNPVLELGALTCYGNVAQGQRGNIQQLLANSDVYWAITGFSWLWGGTAAFNAPYFRVDAPSKAAGKLVGKITVGMNVAATAAEGYDLVTNWDQAGRGDVAKFGVDATLTTVTTILYFTGIGAPVAVILTGVQIANTLGAFDSVYESFNEPTHGGGGSW